MDNGKKGETVVFNPQILDQLQPVCKLTACIATEHVSGSRKKPAEQLTERERSGERRSQKYALTRSGKTARSALACSAVLFVQCTAF